LFHFALVICTGLPVSAHYCAQCFIITLLVDCIEIHDVVSLNSLQRISFNPAGSCSLSLCIAFVETNATGGNSSTAAAAAQTAVAHSGGAVRGLGDTYLFVCTGEQLFSLKMLSVAHQVRYCFFAVTVMVAACKYMFDG
jgi:hypothetical protein